MSTDGEAKKKAIPDEEAKKKATPDEEAKKKGTTDEEAKKKARLARFAPAPKTDSLEEEKRKARMIRYDHCKLLSFISFIDHLHVSGSLLLKNYCAYLREILI